MQDFPVWTLEEANAVLHELSAMTDDALERLAEIEKVWGGLPWKKYDAIHGVAEEDIIRAEWAHRVMAMGVQPKGFFVVDFQSPDPDTLYCWAQGEDSISHEHKMWETFTDRRPITDIRRFEGGPPAPPFGYSQG